MRGDSLRDLYAKTLALLGLGVLAGAGALVDYWPVGVNLPDAGSALDLPVQARALPVSHQLSVRIVARDQNDQNDENDQNDALRAPRHVALPDHTIAPAVAFTALPVTGPPESGLGAQVGLAAPIMRTATAETPVSLDLITATSESYEPSSPFATAGTVELQQPVYTSTNASTDGFITGAFKKTGSSIVKTGLKTGSSIYDAVRLVGGAVRKALPD
ncbi:MAG: hypothetical protein ABI634_12720 [Acidobacteriota bacterium]